MWVYAYEIVPPQAKDRLRMIRAMLDQECSDARCGGRTWAGQLVVEEQVSHILVVSDGPDQAREINRRIEAELTTLEAGFSVTAPMPVVDDGATPSSDTHREV